MKYLSAFALMFSIACQAFAFEAVWRDENGNPSQETEAKRSINGFGGWLLVTGDENWREKWDTPSNTIPNFNAKSALQDGERISILSFFANPKLTDAGTGKISCDLDVTKPDGSSSTHETNLVCFEGKLKSGANMIYLSAPVLVFSADPTDPEGKWNVRITLKDEIGKVVLPLKASFTLRRATSGQ